MRFGAILIVCDLFVVIGSVIQLITLQVFFALGKLQHKEIQ